MQCALNICHLVTTRVEINKMATNDGDKYLGYPDNTLEQVTKPWNALSSALCGIRVTCLDLQERLQEWSNKRLSIEMNTGMHFLSGKLLEWQRSENWTFVIQQLEYVWPFFLGESGKLLERIKYVRKLPFSCRAAFNPLTICTHLCRMQFQSYFTLFKSGVKRSNRRWRYTP